MKLSKNRNRISTNAKKVLMMLFLLLSLTVGIMGQEIRLQYHLLEDRAAGIRFERTSVYQIMQDRKGWIWAATIHGLAKFDGQRYKIYQHDPDDPHSLIENFVVCIEEDRQGKIWVGTLGGGLDRYDPETDQFTHYQNEPNNPKSLASNRIYAVLEDQHQNLWIGTDKGLHFFDRTNDSFEQIQIVTTDQDSVNNNRIIRMVEDPFGMIWIGTHDGLNRFDPVTRQLVQHLRFHNDKSSDFNSVRALMVDSKQTLWVSAQNQLTRINLTDQQIENYFLDNKGKEKPIIHSIYESASGALWLASNKGLFQFDTKNRKFYRKPTDDVRPHNVTAITQDREGLFWMGTYTAFSPVDQGGLYAFKWREAPYKQYQHIPSNLSSLSDNRITRVHRDKDGIYWIGTQRGLNRFDPVSQQFKRYLPNPEDKGPFGASENNIGHIVETKDRYLWIGTTNGLKRFDKSNGVFKHYWQDKNNIRAVYRDRKGRLWMSAVNAGLKLYDPDKDQFIQYWTNSDGSDGSKTIVSMTEDMEEKLWLSTYDGLFQFDPNTKTATAFRHDPFDPKSISTNFGHEILGTEKEIWIGTPNGLNRLRKGDTITFDRFLRKDGLPTDQIRNILQDSEENIWIATGGGLSRFDRKSGEFTNFLEIDGYNLVHIPHIDPETGELWLSDFLSGHSGLLIINPDSLPHNDYQPPVYLTRLGAYSHKNAEAGFQDVPAPWAKSTLTLPYHENTFTAEFAVLSYKNPAQNKAAYKLEGVHDDWIPVGSKREATFSNLRPGKYTLRVKGSNNDGVWNEEGTSLQITILPPWWLTFWAKLIYLLLAAGVLYYAYRYQLRRKLDLAEAQRLKELNEVKTRLFTNITHEFRTPLTVIQGMANQTIDQEGQLPPEKHLENAEMIKRNSAQLLTMVNQMLDLRKLESGALPVKMVRSDIVQYLRYLTESFQSYARNKDIAVHFLSEEKEITMDYDAEKLLYIVSNLLSNAIKFTPAGGNVYFGVDRIEDTLKLSVKDTGVGIEPKKIPSIFDRFYQADNSTTRQGEGSGIGLALTRELVKLLGGDIQVKSTLGEGSVFTVTLPVTQTAPEQAIQASHEKLIGFMPATPERPSGIQRPGDTEHPLALIIEDNPDVVRYLRSCLEADYNILTAHNGQMGIATAIDMTPDIIISDVMMPEKNGYEVCEILKNDERTSHIPIILLTAKADQDSLITGLSKGADAYLSKPFHREELQVRLEQMIELRRKLQERFADLQPGSDNRNLFGIEDEFLSRIREIVEENLSDSEFGIAQLCRAVGMSRSQLFRKLKALTGKSASLVIRSIRLQRARGLLQTTKMNVSEVAYEVGFKDLAYFSKCFSEEFGEQPSSVRG